MHLRFAGIAVIALAIFTSVAFRATLIGDPGTCPRSSHLIGRVSALSTDTNGGSWWSLVYHGMLEYGLTTDEQQRDYLNGVFGTDFASLDQVRDFNLKGVSDSFDKNQNGYVCAYDLQGTRAYNDDPLFSYTWFGVSDDKLR